MTLGPHIRRCEVRDRSLALARAEMKSGAGNVETFLARPTIGNWLLFLSVGLMATTAGPGRAQGTFSTPDTRMVVVHAQGDRPIELFVAPGRDLDVLMPAGDHILSVLVGDIDALHVTVPDTQDGFVLTAARPVQGVNVTVRTVARTYAFNVTGSTSLPPPWLVQLEGSGADASSPKTWTPPVFREPGTYRLSGDKAVRPSSIHDDGTHVFLEWPADQPLPAVFGVGATGGEEMVDGYMRSGTFVIDRVYPALVFRIDKAQARAQREIVKTRR